MFAFKLYHNIFANHKQYEKSQKDGEIILHKKPATPSRIRFQYRRDLFNTLKPILLLLKMQLQPRRKQQSFWMTYTTMRLILHCRKFRNFQKTLVTSLSLKDADRNKISDFKINENEESCDRTSSCKHRWVLCRLTCKV